MAEAPRLTADDHQTIAQARELAMLASADAVREHVGSAGTMAAVLASAFGEAQEVIAGLLAIVAGLDGEQITEAGDPP